MSKSSFPSNYYGIELYACCICNKPVLVFDYDYGEYDHHDIGPYRLEPKQDKYTYLYDGKSLSPFCHECGEPICSKCTICYRKSRFPYGSDYMIAVCKQCSENKYVRKQLPIPPDKNKHVFKCKCCHEINTIESDSDIDYPDYEISDEEAESTCYYCYHGIDKPDRPLTKDSDEKINTISFTCPICKMDVCDYHMTRKDIREPFVVCELCNFKVCRSCSIGIEDYREVENDEFQRGTDLPRRVYKLCRKCVNNELIPSPEFTLEAILGYQSSSTSSDDSSYETIEYSEESDEKESHSD